MEKVKIRKNTLDVEIYVDNKPRIEDIPDDVYSNMISTFELQLSVYISSKKKKKNNQI